MTERTSWDLICDERIKNFFPDDYKLYKVCRKDDPITPLPKKWKFNNCVISERYESIMESILDFECKADDIWIITSPRSGK